MQNKYLSALKTKYANFGLSKEALDRVALQRVKTINDESEIESDSASTDTFLLLMKEQQGAIDALRSSRSAIQKQLDDLKKTPDESKVQPQESAENPLAEELKQIKEMFAGLKSEMDAGKKKAHSDAVLASVHEVMKSKGCTNDVIRDLTLKGIEVGESDTAESLAERYKSVYDANCKGIYGEGYKPPMGNNFGSEEIDNDAETAILQKRGLLPKKD